MGFSTMFSKKMIITYKSSARTHPHSILRYLNSRFSCLKMRLHATRHTVSRSPPPPPHTKLIDSPPLHNRNKKCNSTAKPNIDGGKSASEHNFPGESCNFRVFQGILQRQRKIQGFQGLPGFVGHLVLPSSKRYPTTLQ